MLKAIFWIVVGVVIGLEVDRFLDKQKERFRPSALTGTLLDKANERLEAKRGAR
jgi:hypothetical protein